jgi:formylmethanofuran dehydrogenase subunit E
MCNQHCQGCSNHKLRWTLTRFKSEGQQVHGNKYNYDKATESHIKDRNSKVPIKCNQCNYEWMQSIRGHINKKIGCPKCSGHSRWDLQRFLEAGQQTHGDKYDYSAVTEAHIQRVNSKLPVKCRQCNFCWSVSIKNHIGNKTGCPRCSGHIPWNRSRFIDAGQRINGDIHDYSEIRDDHFKGIHSKVPIKCNICKHRWRPKIGNYIHRKSQCPKCAGHLEWNHPRFITQAKQIHGDAYNYDFIRPEEVTGYYSKIPIKCNTCHQIWSPTVGCHIHSKSGCPYCCKSRGERLVSQILNSLEQQIGPYIQQAQYPDITQYRYDFCL